QGPRGVTPQVGDKTSARSTTFCLLHSSGLSWSGGRFYPGTGRNRRGSDGRSLARGQEIPHRTKGVGCLSGEAAPKHTPDLGRALATYRVATRWKTVLHFSLPHACRGQTPAGSTYRPPRESQRLPGLRSQGLGPSSRGVKLVTAAKTSWKAIAGEALANWDRMAPRDLLFRSEEHTS